MEQTDPERIYVENIRSFFGFPYRVAFLLCEAAVKEGIFEKRVGLACPKCGRILTSEEPGTPSSERLACETCMADERDQWEFARSELPTVPFYRLLHQRSW